MEGADDAGGDTQSRPAELLQAAVLDNIEREHLPVNTARVREKVQTICNRVTGKSLHWCLESVGTQSSFGNDIEAIRTVAGSDDAPAREMRDLSPLSILLSEEE
ncbi:hypothetical protein HG717_00170 [Rhodococcus erythropolis]|uniref:hypothetical protein n=1 Tax=Rhodococcus erythropolis TaxID=1833 RepID=UPI001C9ADACB|nr:hypothetical protein [Rhodococcus erythropolis]MBY6382353.1 hypothetical protein [Rhodococcus erythropolis]